jgi:hypothetical protein
MRFISNITRSDIHTPQSAIETGFKRDQVDSFPTTLLITLARYVAPWWVSWAPTEGHRAIDWPTKSRQKLSATFDFRRGSSRRLKKPEGAFCERREMILIETWSTKLHQPLPRIQ